MKTEKHLGRNQVFELLGAKPTNPRWSWCALAQNRRGAVFTIWEDEITHGRSRLTWRHYEAQNRPGASDKARILAIVLKGNIPAYGLICVAVDPTASPRRIKEVKSQFLVRLKIEGESDEIYAEHVGKVHVLEAAREILGYPQENQDGLVDLTQAPTGNVTPDRALSIGTRVIRDPKVRAFVLRRAGGKCEYCGELGFKTASQTHYVEAHHIISLADAGKDTLDNVIALCPKHHREAHFGAEAERLEQEFVERIKALASVLPK
ncbi:MAG: HNH endonuclease [Opitutae bacterium]|nr:HNH endonuclease [Opitutae bacterium]